MLTLFSNFQWCVKCFTWRRNLVVWACRKFLVMRKLRYKLLFVSHNQVLFSQGLCDIISWISIFLKMCIFFSNWFHFHLAVCDFILFVWAGLIFPEWHFWNSFKGTFRSFWWGIFLHSFNCFSMLFSMSLTKLIKIISSITSYIWIL